MDYEEVIERRDLIIKLLAMNIMSDGGTQKDNLLTPILIGITRKENIILSILTISQT